MEEKIKKTIKKSDKKTETKEKVVETKQPAAVGTAKDRSQASKGLIAVVRIAGEVKVKPEIANTLYRLRLRKKYSCVLIDSSNKGLMGMLWRVRHSVAYGDIDKELLVKLLSARGKIVGEKKVDFEKAASELISGKVLEDLGFKPFFRLHPPRKGIDSKLQYPLGVLGNNKNDINKLIERML
jgi:large subunit ribosomal protein L30